MNSPHRLLSIASLIALGSFFTAPTLALTLLSESRSVSVSYYGDGAETITSDGTFGVFDATAIGVPFGGGSVTARQTSNITSSFIEVAHSIQDYYGPGGMGSSDFSVTFSLQHATRISITGYSFYFSGIASLASESQGFPLIWGPDDDYRNYLDFDQVLGPGVYTFATNEWMRGDGISTRYLLQEAVPEGGASAAMLGLGLLSLLAVRRPLS